MKKWIYDRIEMRDHIRCDVYVKDCYLCEAASRMLDNWWNPISVWTIEWTLFSLSLELEHWEEFTSRLSYRKKKNNPVYHY